MLLFSVGNVAMNTPRYWQRRNESSTMLPTAQRTLCDVANCAMMPVTMLRPVQIRCWLYKENGETQFSRWKSRHKCRLSLWRDEFHVHNLFIATSPTPVCTDRSVCVFGNSFFRIFNGCTGRNLDRRIFIKNLRASLFNKELSKEPNFCRIHPTGQYF